MHGQVRKFWQDRLLQTWQSVPIAWLAGVRRVGKTTLARSLPNHTYLNCDLPSVVERLADPETLLRAVDTPIVVFDEVHQLADPSRVLKIAADEFPHLRILATGSSTLAATHKFRDTLTGRKRTVHLVPVLVTELADFGIADLRHRLQRGGLPAALLSAVADPSGCAEWLDSYFARDVQELFRVEKRGAYLQLCELLLRQSGGLYEASSLARATALSRQTVATYLDALQATLVVTLVRPFHGGGRQEVLQQPKVYGFDTGFVAWVRGWGELRPADCGQLWEHVVLEAIQATVGVPVPHFWRDRQQREVDFVLPWRDGRVDAIECKWSADALSPKNLVEFRKLHPTGRNFAVVPGARESYERNLGGLAVQVCDIAGLVRQLVQA